MSVAARPLATAADLRDPLRACKVIDLQHQSALVLCFDSSPLPLLTNVGRVACLTQAPLDYGLEFDVQRPLAAPGVDPRIAALAPVHAIVTSVQRVSVAAIVAAIRYGCREFHFVDYHGGSFRSNARGALAVAGQRTLRRRTARIPLLAGCLERALGQRLHAPWPDTFHTHAALIQALELAERNPPTLIPREGPLKVVHAIGQLCAGGAERQLAHLAVASRQEGHHVQVHTSMPLEGAAAHHAPELQGAGVSVRHLPQHQGEDLLPDAIVARYPAGMLRKLERHQGRDTLIPRLAALLADPPDVLHCWLDEANTVGVLAGLLAGVPRIVLGTRSLNPTHFPDLWRDWYAESYRLAAMSPRVVLLNNSRAGAASYAAWCGVAPSRFRVVPNGFPLDTWRPLADAERLAARAELGIAPDAFVVAGAFRLGPEKRPDDFVAALRLAREQVPNLVGLHLGPGSPAHVADLEAKAGLKGALRFLGRRDDVARVFGLADATLLTSQVEGLPNVSLESQAVGVPAVLTRAGGAPETVDAGETGFLCDVGDVNGLAARLVELARDPVRRRAMGVRGRVFVEERFGVERTVTATLAAYRCDNVTP
ncbi:glycosyltransferase [Planctomycetota bacterium]|nr:glycosyltransferase [Planctomycetota bacterium]